MSLKRAISAVSFLLLISMLAGCASQKGAPIIPPDQHIELADTPFYPQEKYQCGPASLAMVLGASGLEVNPDELRSLTYLPKRRGSLQLELAAASRRYGRIPYEIDPDFTALVSELQDGRPVLVLQNLGLEILPVYHYAVVIGVRPEEKVILRSGRDRRVEMNIARFLKTWRPAGSWGLVVLRPGELPAEADLYRYLRSVDGFEGGGNRQQAGEAYRAALARWPENPDVMFALGNNYLLQGEASRAGDLYRRILTANPHHVAAANNLAEILSRQGCHRQAVQLIGKAVEHAERLNSPLLEQVRRTRRQITAAMQKSPAPRQSSCPDPILSGNSG